MLQQDSPEDFIISTGEQHTVREFLEIAAKEVGIDIEWSGTDINEIGRDKVSGNIIVRIDKRYFRPTEVDSLLGDSSKAKNKLGWKPKITFGQLVKEMMESDLIEAERDMLSENQGYKTYSYQE